MSLFEVFRQKQVKITPEVTVNVEYITVESVADIYARASGEILLVKRQLMPQDAAWLQAHRGHYTVFTTEPKTLDAFDAQAYLTDTERIHLMESIGLNFLHFGAELYAFDDIPDGSPAPGTPNVVRVHPAHRSDVETQLSINLDAIRNVLGISNPPGSPVSDNQAENKPSPDTPPGKEQPKEIDFVRAKLAELFAERYSVLRVRFEGSKPENRTVRLTDFYAKHKIAKGKLRGTWSLFNKAEVKKIMDAGIVDRAKEAALSKVSIGIPGYGTIIRAKDVAPCRATMEKIEADYKAYLSGKVGCTHAGEIKIATAFSPKEALDATFFELRDYLLGLWPPDESEHKYENAVDRFLAKARYGCRSFSDGVTVKPEETAYKESQWESKDFVMALWKAVDKHPDFFEPDIVELLERYTGLLNEAARC